MQKADVVILGAGMVGVSAALHLQARGRDAVLIDRRGGAGLETSFGNAGLIERSSIFPYLFPRDPARLVKYALNLLPEAHYHVSALPSVGPWLMRYWRESSPERVLRNIEARRPLIENSLAEHEKLIQQAGAGALLRKTGWMKLFRSDASLARGMADVEKLRAYGLHIDVLDTAGVAAREPDLAAVAGAAHFLDTASVVDPGALSKAYADLFAARGGRFRAGDALSLLQTGDGRWSVETEEGPVIARDAVVALGPWSDQIFHALGYNLPLGWKRGYHMHYAAREGARLNHPVLDVDVGYLLAPMARGIRLTSGAEFAPRDAPPTPVQIEVCEPIARKMFPLGERLDPSPWRGARPCLPDMLPALGPAPRHKGLWFDFGHAHHGLTLGPVTGRLLAEMMTGETPFIDPRPYRVDRF
ncbi:FAD-binding oxidoreductase [Methylocystis sp. WRRC1]|uniref:NAD(P)/FAD-dependent oxidoreductase n=1 Tax=unclassified Methylocystis TaxID=2625913 RepID=UPI0001F87BEB|nr:MULTISPECIES: FAD-dependent oxidoreductase [unclassified Methylocystis]MCC3245260.1 FAD-binding oxidoreductase [Methylocystis sp. WRRC1]